MSCFPKPCRLGFKGEPPPPHPAPGGVGEKRKVEPMGFYCACCTHGSDWLGPECKRSGKLVVSVFGDFARQWGYAYDMTMWQFFNIEQTSLSGLHAGRKANSVIHRWLFQGDALLILTFGGRHPLCLVIREGVRPASAGRECLAAFQTPCRVYLHAPCAPPWERPPQSAEVQHGHVHNLCSSFLVDGSIHVKDSEPFLFVRGKML